MNAINVDIVRSLFMPLFLGGTLAAAALAVMAILRWGEPGAMVMLAGGVLYVVGMFVVTMVFNVPLNDALAAADPSRTRAVGQRTVLPTTTTPAVADRRQPPCRGMPPQWAPWASVVLIDFSCQANRITV